MRKILGVAMVGALALAGCSPQIINTEYQAYTIHLVGPDTSANPSADPFGPTDKYEVTVKYWEDAAGTIPYGKSLTTLPDEFKGWTPVKTFKFAGTTKPSFILGDGGDQAIPHLKDGASIFVQSEIVGFDTSSTPIARARCPIVELKPQSTAGAPVECKAFYGFIGRWNPIKSPVNPRYSFGMAALPDGRVVIGGGKSSTTADNSAPLGSVEVYEPTLENPDGTIGAWHSLTSGLSVARYEVLASPTPDGKVFFAAGKLSETNYSSAVDLFDGQNLQVLNQLSSPRAEGAIAPFSGNTAIVEGGMATSSSANTGIEKLSTSSGATVVNSANGARVYPCVAAPNPNLVVMCGGGPDTCETFDGTNAPKDGGKMPGGKRNAVKCAAVGGQVYLIGGVDDPNATNAKSIEVWNQSSGVAAWDSYAGAALVHHAVAVANGKVVVAGGYAPGSTDPLKTGFWFDPVAGGGEHPIVGAGTEMTWARAYHEMVGLPDGTVMAVGGKVKAGDPTNNAPGAEIFVVPDN